MHETDLQKPKQENYVDSAHQCKNKTCIKLWYKRLGNIDSIKQLISKSLATGIEIKDCKYNIICENGIKYKLINTPKIMHDPK